MQTPTLAWYVKEYCIENTFRSLLVSTFTGFPASLFKLICTWNTFLKYMYIKRKMEKKWNDKITFTQYSNWYMWTMEEIHFKSLVWFNLKFLYFILIRLYKHVVWLSNDLFCQFLRQFFWVILRIQNIWF